MHGILIILIENLYHKATINFICSIIQNACITSTNHVNNYHNLIDSIVGICPWEYNII